MGDDPKQFKWSMGFVKQDVPVLVDEFVVL